MATDNDRVPENNTASENHTVPVNNPQRWRLYTCGGQPIGTVYPRDQWNLIQKMVDERTIVRETIVVTDDEKRYRAGNIRELKFPPPTISLAKAQILNSRTGDSILDNVTFNVEPGEFVGVLGASGSGKSTLIKSLAGVQSLHKGHVMRSGKIASSSVLQHDRKISYMPQEVVVHKLLTPRIALGYIAVMKEIGESDIERNQRIEEVMQQVGIAHKADELISNLSGGQCKRVALAAELLGDSEVLLLDEATSGLDPASEKEMMELFRHLAHHEKKAVVCVTHYPNRVRLCDRVLYIMKGKVLFDGPPAKMVQFFGVKTIEEVYTKLRGSTDERETANEWRTKFEEEFAQPPGHDAKGYHRIREVATHFGEQWKTLAKRYLDIQRASWLYLSLLLIQAPVIAFLISRAYGNIKNDDLVLQASNISEVIFAMVLSVLWCAGTLSVQEIVKESHILHHELRFGVKIGPYLLSKFALLSVLTLVQAVLLLLIVRLFTGLGGSMGQQLTILMLTSVAGVALGLFVSIVGLFISKVAGKPTESAMIILPIILIVQAIFSRSFELGGIIKFFTSLIVPAYWALDGLKATFDEDLRNAGYPGMEPILGQGEPWYIGLAVLLIVILAFYALAYVALRMTLESRLVSGTQSLIQRTQGHFARLILQPYHSNDQVSAPEGQRSLSNLSSEIATKSQKFLNDLLGKR